MFKNCDVLHSFSGFCKRIKFNFVTASMYFEVVLLCCHRIIVNRQIECSLHIHFSTLKLKAQKSFVVFCGYV